MTVRKNNLSTRETMKIAVTFKCGHTSDRLATDQVDADRMQFVANCHDCQHCFMARVNDPRGIVEPEGCLV